MRTNQALCKSLLVIRFKSEDVLCHIPEELHPHFIRGLSDGDGCFRKEFGKPRHTGYIPQTLEWSLVNQSNILLEHLQTIFASHCAIPLNKLRFYNHAWIWRVRGSRQVMRIASYFYPEGTYDFLPRKRMLFVAELCAWRTRLHAHSSAPGRETVRTEAVGLQPRRSVTRSSEFKAASREGCTPLEVITRRLRSFREPLETCAAISTV
jgi:hypothetical protein